MCCLSTVLCVRLCKVPACMRNAWWGWGVGAKSSSSCGSTMLPWRLHPMQQSTQMASLPSSFYLTVQVGVSSLKCKIKTGLCAVFKIDPSRYRHAFSQQAPQTPEKNTARLLMQAPAAKNGYCVLHLSHVHTLIVSFLR